MNVLFVSDSSNIQRRVGGIPRYAYELVTRMAGFDSVSMKLCGPSSPSLGAQVRNAVNIRRLNLKNFDIIHNLMGYRAYIPLKRPRARVITTAHDFAPVLYRDLVSQDYSSLKARFQLAAGTSRTIASLQSDYLIANSSQTLEEAAILGFPRDRIRVVPSGLDERFLQSLRPRANGPVRIGYLGELSTAKNVQAAIRAFKRVSRPEVRFEIWGDIRSARFPLLNAISSDRRITYSGFAPENHIVETYERFDLMVFPTLYEGFGLPILEAMARGVPVAILKSSKIPRNIRQYCIKVDGIDGLTQAMESATPRDPSLKSLVAAARYAQSLTWERTARETFAFYKEVLLV